MGFGDGGFGGDDQGLSFAGIELQQLLPAHPAPDALETCGEGGGKNSIGGLSGDVDLCVSSVAVKVDTMVKEDCAEGKEWVRDGVKGSSKVEEDEDEWHFKKSSERPQTPYSRPPPLHVTVVAMKDERRVVSWGFDDESGEAKAVLMKENRLVILSDGCSLSKATLFEAFAGRVSLGGAYIMRGYSLRGEGPPFGINITKETQFFRSAPVEVSEELRASAENLLCLASTPTATKDIKSQQGFLTLQGEVVEISAVKKVKVGKDMVPLKIVVLEQRRFWKAANQQGIYEAASQPGIRDAANQLGI
ncbi:uncharacterized protein LOC118494291 [Sander lucioperca]|uniref:uncharacterized protein LOC118494291 n=1 Tax=Sander lucioperca TaxID=283035 RepID=UPI0016534FBF|nr:uncharacterized protein LOC118494291 [Sander lucioperca]